jgi:hypothetical protein
MTDNQLTLRDLGGLLFKNFILFRCGFARCVRPDAKTLAAA